MPPPARGCPIGAGDTGINSLFVIINLADYISSLSIF